MDPDDPAGGFPRVEGPHVGELGFEHVLELPVMGVPVRFRSNESRVIQAVEEAFGAWRSVELRTEAAEGGGWVRVTVVVRDGGEGVAEGPDFRYRYLDRERVVLSTPGSVGVADAVRREVTARVTTELVDAADRFRYGVVEALTLAVVSHLDRTPLHAAALLRGQVTLLLAGRSGAGKSTLCYAAVRGGYDLLAEDHVNLQFRPALRIWGRSRSLHLSPAATEHFPELEGAAVPSSGAGPRKKLAVDVADFDALPASPVVEGARAGLCVLERSEADAPRLERLSTEELGEALPWGAEPGFHVFRDQIRRGVRELGRRGGWRLVLGGHPEEALPLLGRIFGELEDAPGA